MLSEARESETPEETGAKWFNSPVYFYKGKLSEMRHYIPDFERRSFELTQPGNKSARLNERLDTIVRRPFGDDQTFVPIGVVSKDYSLLQHTTVMDQAAAALKHAKISADNVGAKLGLTRYGERMTLSLYLPPEFQFDPGDTHPMALQLECINSVEGSCRFRAVMGWFRFVCRNGLFLGVTQLDLRRVHIGDLRVEDVGVVLASGLKRADAEKKNFERWRKIDISVSRLTTWTEKKIWQAWGFKAATRMLHIARTGFDVEIIEQYKGRSPSTIKVKRAKSVPGVPPQSHNLFDESQILAWLAKERRDVQEQLEWREQIPGLIASLMPWTFEII